MFQKYRAKLSLNRLAHIEKVTYADFVILGEIIRRYYPETSLPSKRYESLMEKVDKKGRSKAPKSHAKNDPETQNEQSEDWTENLANLKNDIQALARLAQTLLFKYPPLPDSGQLEADKRDALQLVNQAFYESEPFQWAKWVLLIALALVGAGSLGIAGFNFLIGEKMTSINKELVNLEGKREELRKTQAAALVEIQNAIAAQRAETQQAFQAQLTESKRELLAKFDETNQFLSDRRAEVVRAVESSVKNANDAISKTTRDGIGQIEEKTKTELDNLSAAAGRKRTEIEKSQGDFAAKVQEVNRLLEEQKSSVQARIDEFLKIANQTIAAAAKDGSRSIAGKAEDEIGALSRLGDRKKADLESAERDVAGRIDEFKQLILDQRKRAEERVNVAIEDAKRSVEATSTKAVRDITDQANNQTANLKTLTDAKAGEIASASQRSVLALSNALTEKLPELNDRAVDASKRIETIVSTVAAQEQNFVTGMNDRLAVWDRTVAAERIRLDELARRLPEVEEQQRNLVDRLDGVIKIYRPALEVAKSLSDGTWTGKLPLIGAVLEQSALLLLLGLGLTGLTLFIWFIKLCLWWWHNFNTSGPEPTEHSLP